MKNLYRVIGILLSFSIVVQPIFADIDTLTIPSEETSISDTAVTETFLPSVTTSSDTSPESIEGSTIIDSNENITPSETEELIVVPEKTSETNTVEAILPESSTVRSVDTIGDIRNLDTYVPGEVIVKYKEHKIDLDKSSGRKLASSLARSASLEKKEELRGSNITVLKITDEATVEEKIDELESNPNVEYAQPNYLYYPTSITSNDTSKDLLWGLDNIGQEVNGQVGTEDADIDAPEAWAINEGTNAPVIVAVIDTGVAYNHPDLASNMWDGTNCKDENGNALGGCLHGYDYEDEDKNPLPTASGHGTHIAGIIASIKDNTTGVIGVAPHTKIMALKTSLSSSDNVRSINFAKQNGARIINASWIGYGNDTALYDAITAFPGLFVAAAGNTRENIDTVLVYPAGFQLDNIITVGATDQNDALANFSNYGTTTVDVAAPGVNIYSTFPSVSNTYAETFETSAPPTTPLNWTPQGTANNWGTYNLDDGDFWGNVLYGDLAVPYANDANTTISSPTIDLRTSGANIDFLVGCDTEYSLNAWTDYMQLEYSVDGTNFTVATDPFTGEEFRWDEVMLDALNQQPLDETGGVALHYEHITIPEQYHTSNFKFQFRWVTNATDNVYSGCFVDNIRVTSVTDGTEEHYEYLSGTSMATPHVAGLAALIEGFNPNLSDARVKDTILATGDSLPSLATTTATGKRINAYSALTAINPTKVITGFTIPNQVGDTTINETDHNITLTLPENSDVTNLVPTITFSGATISPASEVPQDFTSSVPYTVTAADGSMQIYQVTVLVSQPQPPVVTVEPAKKKKSSGGGGGGGGGGGSSKLLSINDGAPETSSQSVTLSISPVKSATHIRIANTPDFEGIAWTTYKKSLPWTLTSGKGFKTVYIQYGKNNSPIKRTQDSIKLTASKITKKPNATSLTTSSKKSPYYLFTKDISLGMTGTDVTELQKRLIKEKYLLLTVPTGYYGTLTSSAVRVYQKTKGLTQTGILDSNTRKLLNSAK